MQRNCWQMFYPVIEQSIAWKADCVGLLAQHVLQLPKSTNETVDQLGVSAKEPSIAIDLIER